MMSSQDWKTTEYSTSFFILQLISTRFLLLPYLRIIGFITSKALLEANMSPGRW